ncbi:kinase-like protein [Lophiostoma macrostomum CBS 122681]|uniref:non-specific serine/threonine protein kinase n=1 Tax=Lophiostoma macrostomum CBS 122681 TaxID=1314788 RepID=A0A6A6SN73_9PLEO|nr:kinase-like protein [Lophiostoma macrostomum CBS 122681]
MEAFRLQPPPAVGTKAKAIQQAKEFEEIVSEKSRRSGIESPPYDFIELIGKGSFGRVFKGKNRSTHELVAIKIIDVDKFDYEGTTEENLQQTLREINILQQLKDSRARPYVNIIEEARNVHNELWVISEYASGGSVGTLLKPNAQRLRTGLEEKYIIPIARELALGLKFIHEAGILHRDLKCGNVLVLEDGRVQLCDFGVSGAVESEKNKRSTIVGSVHWMPPELRQEFIKENNGVATSLLYGSEIDIWAYGCTVYEMATGRPPFSDKNAEDAALVVEVPTLEGKGNFSETLNDLVSFVCQPNADERPTPDEILEHPYLVESSKIYPTMTLIQLVRQYYVWEHSGGSRISLFNGYGAPAPDPLAPQEDDEEDWTFSTSEEFDMQQRASMNFNDPFITVPPGDMSVSVSLNESEEDDEDDELGPRMKRLRRRFKEEAIERGGRRLHKIFDVDSTPYRYSMVDSEPGAGPGGRPVSDLALRNEEAQSDETVETVIDLDDAVAPIAPPQTMVGEVPTLRASRRLTRDDDEARDYYDADQTIRRGTRDFNDQPNRRTMDWKFEDQTNRRTMDWKFETQPPMPAQPTQSTQPTESIRRTMDWTFDDFQQESDLAPPPAAAPALERTNRRTMEWTFDISMAEASHDSHIKAPRLSRLREEPEFTLSALDPSQDQNRRTRDFVFPMRDPGPRDSLSASMSNYRPSLLHAIREPSFDDYPRVNSAPQSPLRTSMIDLDDANVDDYRPSTSHSTSTSILTAGTEQMNGNPFDLEDQVHLSQNNNRASYHMKSQSEPNHALPGLLTPQTYDEHGNPLNQDSYHLGMHARGVSSVSQMQAKAPPNNITYARQRPPQRPIWDSWSHQDAYKIDESPPDSTSTATSPEDDRSVDEMWSKLEQDHYGTQQRRQPYLQTQTQNQPQIQISTLRSRRTASQDEEPRSDAEDNYTSDPALAPLPASFDDHLPTTRRSRISLGPNGRPLIDFPIPRGPDTEALSGAQVHPSVLGDMLFKSALDMRNALGTSRALLGSFKPVESGLGVNGGAGLNGGMGMRMGTLRKVKGGAGASDA